MRETAEKLRKTMEQQARQQSEYMTTKDQLTSTEKAKVRETPFNQEFHSIRFAPLLWVVTGIISIASSLTGGSGVPSERTHHSSGGRCNQCHQECQERGCETACQGRSKPRGLAFAREFRFND